MILKKLIKNLVKNTQLYKNYKQIKISDLHFYSTQKYTGLLPYEKTKKRICFYEGDKIKQLKNLFEKLTIKIEENKRFQFWLDTGFCFFNTNEMTDGLPPNYELILNYSLEQLINENINKSNQVEINNFKLLNIIEKYVKKIVETIDKEIKKHPNDSKLKISKQYFSRMLTDSAKTLEEGFQRILFWSSIFWQTKHTLIGIGRLDKLLEKLEAPLDKKERLAIIKDFYKSIHSYYANKSNNLLGDTGQLIVLGGKQENGSYFCNNLTYEFIEALEEIKLPDPKILLRVSSDMPDDLLKLSLECIATGIGCPLLANDEVIIPSLINFGYEKADAYNYVTSACWEPLPYGKGLGRGNLFDVNYGQIIEDLYKDKRFTNIKSFEEVEQIFFEKIEIATNKILKNLDSLKWEYNPLMTLFTDGCKTSGKDISEGGAKYNDYGILTVGLANAINSLFNIKKIVFEDKLYTLKELKEAAEANFENKDDLRGILSSTSFFGHEEDDILKLTNKALNVVSSLLSKHKNNLGGKIKTGFSSPNYMAHGERTGATLDGRKKGTALSVHISSKLGEAYTELMNFAGKLNYDAFQANGSVVDFFVSPDFINKNFDKFLLFLKASIKIGFFELQMNVVSSKTLIEAKKNPELYPNLIVRVWGFSAYFKDLPEEYKDILIIRARESESAA